MSLWEVAESTKMLSFFRILSDILEIAGFFSYATSSIFPATQKRWNMEVQLVVASGSRAGQAIRITGSKFIIGRADDCHLKPRSDLISRYHCAIISEDGYVAIRDLGSKNGVFLNGQRVPLESELKNGDKLNVGPLEFIVNLSVGIASGKKPKVESVEDALVRTAEISEAAAAADPSAVAVDAVSVAPATEPAAPAPQPVAAPPPVPAPAPVAAAPAPQPAVAAPAPVAEVVSEPEDNETGLNIADWLLGSDESGQDQETKTVKVQRMPSAGVYTPDDPVVEETPDEKPEEEDPSSKFRKPKAATSKEAATNLLKSFFRGR